MGSKTIKSKLIGVQLYVKDLKRDAEYYRDCLGLDLHCVEEDTAVLEAGELMLLLFKGTPKSIKPLLVFETNEIAKAMKRLSGKGLKLQSMKPKKFERGYTAIFKDLSGNRHELVQYT